MWSWSWFSACNRERRITNWPIMKDWDRWYLCWIVAFSIISRQCGSVNCGAKAKSCCFETQIYLNIQYVGNITKPTRTISSMVVSVCYITDWVDLTSEEYFHSLYLCVCGPLCLIWSIQKIYTYTMLHKVCLTRLYLYMQFKGVCFTFACLCIWKVL